MKVVLALTALVGLAVTASAGIGLETYGSVAPPGTVFGIPVSPAPFRSDIFADTSSTAIGPGGVTATFSSPVSVRQIGLGWATWSHGYTGNVFYTNGQTSITMTLSPGLGAFQFYAEPNPFGVFSITATGSDGSSSISATQAVEGSAGASGWGFYGTAGSSVASVSVSSDVDFAIGEFATMPTPGSLVILGLSALGAGRRR